MIRWTDRLSISAYRVKLGHHSIEVFARSRDEALAEARDRLSLELPRLWDVIHSLDAERFEIETT